MGKDKGNQACLPSLRQTRGQSVLGGGETRTTTVKLFVRFRLLILRYLQPTTCSAQISDFEDVFNMLIISRLNFTDTY